MAYLGNTLINGSLRCLNKAYFNDLSVSGIMTVASLSTTGNATIGGTLGVTGATTIAGTLTLTKTTDVSGTANNSPALIIGGTATDKHIEIDRDEIQAKTNGTSVGDLWINNDGGTVHIKNLNSTTSTIATGNITTLNASTVTADNVTVNNVLKSSKWDISNVANLANDFMVAPTIKISSEGKVTISNLSTTDTTSKTCRLTFSDSSQINSDEFAGCKWYAGSRVRVTFTVNGTLNSNILGTIANNMNTTAGTLVVDVTLDDRTNITNGTYEADDSTIMLYEISNSGTLSPVGIRMTAYGTNNSSYIDMYGGTTASSYTQPVFRIGNLGGISYNGNILPAQWGVYTYNGYFEGAIVANEGKIGEWTIDAKKIYTGTWGSNNSAMMSPGTTSTDGNKSIGGSDSISGWTFTSGANFGVNKDGSLYANKGKIGGLTIDGNKLYTNGHSAYNSAKDGVYISTDYISFGNGGVTYFKNDGTGKIGTWVVGSNALTNGTWGANNSAMVCTGSSTAKAIGGSESISGWTFTSGANFGVTKDGALYANKGKIGGLTIDGNKLYTNEHSAYNTAKDGIYISTDYISFGNGGIINFKNDGTGKIGNWVIDTDRLYYGTWGTANSAMLCPVGTGDDEKKAVGGSSSISGWTFTSGANFGVTNTGAMYAKSGKIAGFTINSSRIYYSTLGNDKSVNVSTGTSSTVSIGGSASGTTNYWTITSGAKFGVTREGVVYASDVNVTGAINATSLHVGASTSTNHLIYENSTINLQTDWLKFDSSTSIVTIGKDNAPRVGIDGKSMYIKNNAGGEYFYVGDVRSNNIYQFTTSNPESCIASQTTQIITNYKINLNYNVSIKDQDGNSVSYTKANESGVITGTFVKNRVYNVAYTTSEPVYRMYFGNKLDTSTIATSYNHALIIGNGTTSSNRPHSLALDWSGNLTCAGTITCSSKIPIHDTAFWNGISMTVWCCGSVVTANFYGTESGAIGAGVQNAYFTLPAEYRPFQEINQIFVDQNNRRVIFKVKTNGEIGIYYLLDGITSPTNLWGSLTWIAYQ